MAGRETIRIPANCMKTIVGSTQQNKKRHPYVAAVQPISSEYGSLLRNILVVDTISVFESGRIPVRMFNIDEDDVWIQPKTRIGILH